MIWTNYGLKQWKELKHEFYKNVNRSKKDTNDLKISQELKIEMDNRSLKNKGNDIWNDD